jgi:thymidylate synthase (FAD)|tara:strand:+ start:474 stop:1130 length:657 start_codon:yes stop_codon:yes gene_type:complete
MSEVKLIAYTQSKEIAGITSQDIMAYCARVSNPSNQNNSETAEKLLNYCVRNKHWSVFEMCNVVIEINTTRDIARQILRHRSFHFQEFSQRYANPNELGFETREFRLQDTKNRQNSIEVDEDNEMTRSWKLKQDQLIHETKLAYKWAIENGIAKEQARAVLPEGLTMSRMYMNGTVRDWIHYCKLRMGPETQKEHRVVAKKCWDVLVKVYPFLETLEM